MFIHHIDTVNLSAEVECPDQECIKLVQLTVETYKRYKGNLSFEAIHIIGGNQPAFRQRIKYILLLMNVSSEDVTAATLITDRTIARAVLCMAQYFRTKDERQEKKCEVWSWLKFTHATTSSLH